MPNQLQFPVLSDSLNPLPSVRAEVESAQCSALPFIKESGCWEYQLQAGFGGEDEQGEDQGNLRVREDQEKAGLIFLSLKAVLHVKTQLISEQLDPHFPQCLIMRPIAFPGNAFYNMHHPCILLSGFFFQPFSFFFISRKKNMNKYIAL